MPTAHPLLPGCAGLIKGKVNQKVLPSPTLDMAPSMPPNTDTCLEQMLSPKPVPPLVLGRFMSSSVPCKTSSKFQHLRHKHFLTRKLMVNELWGKKINITFDIYQPEFYIKAGCTSLHAVKALLIFSPKQHNQRA